MVLSALKIFKNYIARCDFWSCRHFVDRLRLKLHFNIKISFCIVKANILNYLSKCIKIIRKFAVFNPLTKHIANINSF